MSLGFVCDFEAQGGPASFGTADVAFAGGGVDSKGTSGQHVHMYISLSVTLLAQMRASYIVIDRFDLCPAEDLLFVRSVRKHVDRSTDLTHIVNHADEATASTW